MKAAIGEAFRHRGFWLLNLGCLACGFQLAFIATHLPAYLLDRGLAATDAVAALAIIALTNVAGTYMLGLWGCCVPCDYVPRRSYPLFLAREVLQRLAAEFEHCPARPE